MDLNEDEQTLSYYGGIKGQFIHFKGGKVLEISNNNEKETKNVSRQGPLAASSHIASTENDRPKPSFAKNFDKIQQAAARLVAIQGLAKRKGSFSPEDNRVYAASLLELGQAAQSLAMLQQTGEIQDFSVLLQPIDNIEMPQKTPFNSDNKVTIETATQAVHMDAVTEQHFTESELLPPNHEDPYEDDSVAISPPKKDASVAEAKPIGVSIAGDGGVASAKPNAVALAGRNGLAVSAPKATAIAGVTAEEAAAFSVSLPSRHNLVIKTPTHTHLPSPSYYNYDDMETSPLQANTRNTPLLRSASSGNTNAKPMQATINAADAIMKMWRTTVAEDQAAAYETRKRNNDLNIEQYFRNYNQINQHRTN